MRGISAETVRAAAYGGAILGGGGGGSIEQGLRLGRLAVEVGRPRLASLDEMADEAVLVTVAAVGAPSARDQHLEPMHYVQALELLAEHLDKPVAGLITNENGGLATLNGWFQSAVMGLPVVDAPCNGRAHPTGLMGAMGLDSKADYLTRQAAVGGDPDAGRHVRLYAEGSLTTAARLVRQAAVEAGGLVAVARNPITAAYARGHAAPGAIQQAIDVGQVLLSTDDSAKAAEAVCQFLGGSIVCKATVENVRLRSEGGFDVGQVELAGGYELTFWNEYMTLERQGQRLATFPDLLVTLSAAEPQPLSSAEIAKGQDIWLLHVPRERLILGAGMRQPALFQVAEQAVGKELVRYLAQ